MNVFQQGLDKRSQLTLPDSGKLRHGPQFALICSLQEGGGGLYLRALDEET